MRRVLKILLIILVLILSLIILFFASSKFSILWPRYSNIQFGFSLKHPLFLGTWYYLPVPATFTNHTDCSNRFPPPNSSFDEYFPTSDDGSELNSYTYLPENQVEAYASDKFTYIYGSGDCDFSVFEKRDISIYIFNNPDLIPFEKFVDNSLRIYNDHFKHRFESDRGDNYHSEKIKITKNKSEGILIQSYYFDSFENDKKQPVLPIYYQKLKNDRFLVITSDNPEILMKIISTIKTLNIPI